MKNINLDLSRVIKVDREVWARIFTCLKEKVWDIQNDYILPHETPRAFNVQDTLGTDGISNNGASHRKEVFLFNFFGEINPIHDALMRRASEWVDGRGANRWSQ